MAQVQSSGHDNHEVTTSEFLKALSRNERSFVVMMLYLSIHSFALKRTELREAVNVEPPVRPLYLLALALPRADREKMIGDLTEEYHELIPRFGVRRANLYLWVRVTKELWPLILKGWEKVKKIWKWLIAVGLFGTGFGSSILDLIHKLVTSK